MESSIKNKLIFDIEINEENSKIFSDIEKEQLAAENELKKIHEEYSENIKTLEKITSNCDKMDYILAICSGSICGMLDIFLVRKPGESKFEEITDKWFEDRTKDFAKICGWNSDNNSIKSAIKYLEKKFKIPYDQRGAGDAASWVFDLTPQNHHFKSLAHNPTLLGLYFSILNQFTNTSNFVTNGELISLEKADEKFELRGTDIPSKFFCAFVNWFGHLISDLSGSSSSMGRGMGIPSPFWSWTNDVIAIKRNLKIPVAEFDKIINELALNIYLKGYDVRLQTIQIVPVFINELIVRFTYSVRRLLQYLIKKEKGDVNFSMIWKSCEPFSNATVKRMLTMAHSTFCLLDISEAMIQGFAKGAGSFNISECVMNLNIIGIGRFSVSLYDEFNRKIDKDKIQKDIRYLSAKEVIINDYIEGLKELANIYNDSNLTNFVNDFKNSDLYINAFQKSVLLAEKRNVDNNKILKNKTSIDNYFTGGNN